MKLIIKYLAILFLITSIESCSYSWTVLLNPKKPGKIPQFSEEQLILGKLDKLRACYDVNYYDLCLEIIPSEKKLVGIVEIYAKATEDFDSLQIDLHKNLIISKLIDKEDGSSLPYRRKERAIILALSKKKDEKFILRVSYHGNPLEAERPPWVGGVVWEKDKDEKDWIGVACESEGSSVWWPSKDHSSDEPDSMRMHYTVPNGLIAVGNGQYEGKSVSKTTTTYNWFVSYPINAYNVTFYVGNFKKIEEEYIGINNKKLAITHFVSERNYEKAKNHFKQLHDHLSFYEKRFGEYPWYRDGFKLVESPYAGMEHQTAIAYGNGFYNFFEDTDHIILHETAHEWWGNSVTAKDFAHMWLQEGFATYAEALYFEKYGFDIYENLLYSIRGYIKNKYPLVSQEGIRWFDYRNTSDVYYKGAWIIHTLRNQINDDLVFLDIIKTFYERYKYKLVGSNDFIDIVNEKTKNDYNWFFNHYLYKNECPVLLVYISDDGNIYFKWKNTDPEFNKFKVKLKFSNRAILLTPTTQVQKMVNPNGKNEGWSIAFIDDALIIFERDKKICTEYFNATHAEKNTKTEK